MLVTTRMSLAVDFRAGYVGRMVMEIFPDLGHQCLLLWRERVEHGRLYHKDPRKDESARKGE